MPHYSAVDYGCLPVLLLAENAFLSVSEIMKGNITILFLGSTRLWDRSQESDDKGTGLGLERFCTDISNKTIKVRYFHKIRESYFEIVISSLVSKTKLCWKLRIPSGYYRTKPYISESQELLNGYIFEILCKSVNIKLF